MIEGKVKVAFIGCGGIHWPHLNGYMDYGDKCQVVACCDNNEASAKASAEKCGGKVYTDWKQMLATEGANIDAVDICLPHHLHKESIIDAARAGKHVICEKPLCLNLKEADEIIAEVNKAGVTYMSAHNQVFDPIVENVKRLLAENAIGDLFYVRTQDCFIAAGFAQSKANMNWRGDVAKQGGGELIDTGYHPSYLLLHIVGSPIEKITAACSTFRLPMDAEDTALVTVKFQNGVIGQVMTSWAMPRLAGTHQIHCVGSTGQIYGSGNQLYLLPNGFQEPAHIQYQAVGNIQMEVKHFIDCIKSGAQPRTGLQQGRDVLELIVKAVASSNS